MVALYCIHIRIPPKNLALDEIPNDKHLPGLRALYSSFLRLPADALVGVINTTSAIVWTVIVGFIPFTISLQLEVDFATRAS